MNQIEIANFINKCFVDIDFYNANQIELKNTLDFILKQLDDGTIKVVEVINKVWQVNTWVKEAILLAFKIYPAYVQPTGLTQFFDKFPNKFANWAMDDFTTRKVRNVPPTHVRYGAYIADNVVLMNCFVNMGAYIDTHSMIDSFAVVGSCAHIGKNVHLGASAGVGGVLEPIQATPCIIEDNCFIGAGSWVTEGVLVEENSVIGTGVYLSKTTKIFNRQTKEISYGVIPKGSVVVSGSIPDSTNSCHLQCAVIVKQVDLATRQKVAINELLRD